MCGIAGILRYNGIQRYKDEIIKMTKALSHRGPDDQGIYETQNIAIGHTRLAIIDLKTGKQPMSNENQSIWISYNGELYNFNELKIELIKKGHIFKSQSDTEVIIHSYEEWGRECVLKFRGMFAFAIADFNKNKLFMARDHFGIKPLLYRLGKEYFAFASEHRALLNVYDEVPSINLEAIDLYLRYQYVPTPYSIYNNIFKLPPAHFMEIDFNGTIYGPIKYWDINFSESKNKIKEKEWIEYGEEVIKDSVKAHLVSDVPFGVFLSGGIDSTLVATFMSKILGKNIKAFTIGFDDESISEISFAKVVAEKNGINLYTEIVDDLSLEMLPQLVLHYGEPFGDCSTVPTWYVSRLARQNVPMVLSGDGGDEGFAGYQSYISWMILDHFKQAKRMLKALHLISAYKSFVRGIFSYFNNKKKYDYNIWQKQGMICTNEEIRRRMWKNDYVYILNTQWKYFEEASKYAQKFNRLSYAQYLDYHSFLSSDILTKVDIASMFHGLEVRTPLIDLKVAELFTQIPESLKIRYDNKNGWQGKYLLKKILLKYYGSKFVYRKKQGFAPPRKRFFYENGLARKILKEKLLDSNSAWRHYFEEKTIRMLLDTHNENKDNSGILWVLLILFIWLDLYESKKII